MIYFIIGASGSGKTACLEPLKQLLPDFSVYDFDDIGVPDNADKKWRQEATEAWIKKITSSADSQNHCLLGQMVPGEIIAAPSASKIEDIRIILLDCSDVTRIKRLKIRNNYGINQDTLNWSSWLRMHCSNPQWEQHVIQVDSSDIMKFARWEQSTEWKGLAHIDIIDTSNLNIIQASENVSALIKRSPIYNNIQNGDISFSVAGTNDLEDIIALLSNDTLGSTRENYSQPLNNSYIKAFKAITKDENAKIIITKLNDKIVGVAQINFITNLTYQGGIRAQIEGVRIHKNYRSQGLGKRLFEHLISLAKQESCHMVQLTTDKSRPDAFQFYQRLGFKNSHEGFKLHLKRS